MKSLFEYISDFPEIWGDFPTCFDLTAPRHTVTFTLLLNVVEYSLKINIVIHGGENPDNHLFCKIESQIVYK